MRKSFLYSMQALAALCDASEHVHESQSRLRRGCHLMAHQQLILAATWPVILLGVNVMYNETAVDVHKSRVLWDFTRLSPHQDIQDAGA